MKQLAGIGLVMLALAALAAPPAMVGRKAPEFSATDLDGNTVSLADFQGQLLVMHFATSW